MIAYSLITEQKRLKHQGKFEITIIYLYSKLQVSTTMQKYAASKQTTIIILKLMKSKQINFHPVHHWNEL